MDFNMLMLALTCLLAGIMFATFYWRMRMASMKGVEDFEMLEKTLNEAKIQVEVLRHELLMSRQKLIEELENIDVSRKKMDAILAELADENAKLKAAVVSAESDAKIVEERYRHQQEEIKSLREKFFLEFERMANQILDQKSEKFTRQNAEQLQHLLKPFGENIDQFRKQVQEAYDQESKERFSLGKEVSRLMDMNAQLSEDARQLTQALKGNSKAQGDWGQVLLENLLEHAGLRRGHEYTIQEFLRDEHGKTIVNETGRKMQPDVIIHYPDQRKVIIDAKVSLTDYVRYCEATEQQDQDKYALAHIRSLRRHIDELHTRGYQDHAASLDFVMMFVPNEPAYILGMSKDPLLWQYAYDKRILLISPTNLIAALRLIADLWKREYQNRNAQEIAKRGAAMLDKLHALITSLQGLGLHLDRTQKSYSQAMNQLCTGRGNLLRQASQLQRLGVRSRKKLPNREEE